MAKTTATQETIKSDYPINKLYVLAGTGRTACLVRYNTRGAVVSYDTEFGGAAEQTIAWSMIARTLRPAA